MSYLMVGRDRGVVRQNKTHHVKETGSKANKTERTEAGTRLLTATTLHDPNSQLTVTDIDPL